MTGVCQTVEASGPGGVACCTVTFETFNTVTVTSQSQYGHDAWIEALKPPGSLMAVHCRLVFHADPDQILISTYGKMSTHFHTLSLIVISLHPIVGSLYLLIVAR
jgi:hypothetical protein